ncbi:MAG: SsrA-binding protein SmpB [Geminicoccaceae bacterium]|nr:SsrA-binding protein SmpB [Geminicoccaceae bacterium]
MAKDQEAGRKSVARNRRATFDYFIDERMEAGVVLAGSEVKSLRAGRGNINEAYAAEQGGELFLINAYIPDYAPARHFGHDTRRPRKLLMKKREISKLIGALQKKGQTLIPLNLYFNKRGLAKIELGLAHGKKQHDKRHAIKDRDWKREQQRLMRRHD